MSEFGIRRVQSSDWQELREVRLRALADSPDAFGTLLAEDAARGDEHWQSRAADKNVAQFLAYNGDDSCVGMVVGAPFRGEENTAGLFGMWVAPEVRGCGLGRELVNKVITWASGEGYSRLLLHVAKANSPALRLYESCGFTRTGRTFTLPPPREHIGEYEMELIIRPTM